MNKQLNTKQDEIVKQQLETKLCNRDWVKIHKEQLLALFPLTLTHIRNIDLDVFDTKINALGFTIETQYHFDSFMFIAKTIKLYLEDKSNPSLIVRNSNFNPDNKV